MVYTINMEKIYHKFKSFILYGMFGIVTTLTNFILYFIATRVFKINLFISNILAFLITTLVAYYGNKYFVFKNKKDQKKNIKEITRFYLIRMLSLLVESLMLFVLVKQMGYNDFIIKFIAGFIAIILNYSVTKLWIFTKN